MATQALITLKSLIRVSRDFRSLKFSINFYKE